MIVKVVFLDRDGVINAYPGDNDYVKSWEEFHFLPGVKQALKKLSDAQFKIFVISNQAGVSKGIYSQQTLDLITENMLRELKRDGVSIGGVYYCVHKPVDNCSCRKPKTGLIEKAIAQLKGKREVFDSAQSYFIGDSLMDIEAGKNAALKTVLIFSGKENPQNKDKWHIFPDYTFADLSEAVEKLILA